MRVMASIYLVNDTKYFSTRQKFSRWKLVCKFFIKVAMLSAVSFSELSLLVLLLFSYSLIKFRAGFVLSEYLTYTFRSKISLHVEAEKLKGISTAINPLRTKDGMEF